MAGGQISLYTLGQLTAGLTSVWYYKNIVSKISTKMKLIVLTALVAVAVADVAHLKNVGDEKSAKILKQDLDVGPEGSYQWSYETDNGISASESGQLKAVDKENAAESVQGQASWTAPNGEPVNFQYTADENGYVAQGSHIPTSPPIPEAIIRALEYIRAHPPKEQP